FGLTVAWHTDGVPLAPRHGVTVHRVEFAFCAFVLHGPEFAAGDLQVPTAQGWFVLQSMVVGVLSTTQNPKSVLLSSQFESWPLLKASRAPMQSTGLPFTSIEVSPAKHASLQSPKMDAMLVPAHSVAPLWLDA